VKPALQSNEVSLIIHHTSHRCISSLVFIPKVGLGPQTVRIEEF
jgi:hypothetical protein